MKAIADWLRGIMNKMGIKQAPSSSQAKDIVAPDLGKALLHPGRAAAVNLPKPPTVEIVAPKSLIAEAATPVPTPAPASARPLLDDMRTDIPVRTPEEIQALIPLENEEQRNCRIDNDHQRYQWAMSQR